MGDAGSKNRNFPWIAKRAATFIDQIGHRVTLRCDNEPAIEALGEGDIAQVRQAERSAGDSSPSGLDSRGRTTTSKDEQSTVTGQHVPRKMSGKKTPQGHGVAVTTQEASDRSREKTTRVAHNENNSLNWVSISPGGSAGHDAFATSA